MSDSISARANHLEHSTFSNESRMLIKKNVDVTGTNPTVNIL